LVLAGATILKIGVTSTFVDSDLRFIGVDRAALDDVSARLVPLVAHDRVGFAGGVIVGGLLVACRAHRRRVHGPVAPCPTFRRLGWNGDRPRGVAIHG
jgi:hypothetical protein